MMGRQAHGQERLFYEFSLDGVVPLDHLVRRIDAVLDTSWVHRELAPFYSTLGRPSVDPELMIRMLIVGYVFAIRSEREICRDVQVNLAYRWFCGLGLEDRVPNHSVFSRARSERFRDSDLLRSLFEHVVMSCIEAGLVGGHCFAVDASLIQADANKQRSVPGAQWDKPRSLNRASRAVKEYVATLDDAAFGAASDIVPKFVSPSDPASQWTGAHKGPAFFAYADNYLIDSKRTVIVDVEASRAIRPAEVGAARTMIERTEERFGMKPKCLAGDTAYGAAPMLAWLVKEKDIEPHIPVFDRSARKDGTLSRADFTYDADHNVYICPQGKPLTTTGRVHQDRTVYYRSSRLDCAACPQKSKCCPKAPSRRIPRDIDEDARDHARSLAGTPAFEQSRRDRKKVEMAFAHLKRIFGLGRLRLRGPCGAQDEFLLAATAQNLIKLARNTARPPPLTLACALRQDQPTIQMAETDSATEVKLPRQRRVAAKANLDPGIDSACQIIPPIRSDFCNIICHEQTPAVTRPSRSSATGPIDNYACGTLLHW